MNNDNMNRIKMARMKKNLSIKQLADKLHIEHSVMKGIELGAKFPPLDILIKMCSILDVSSDALLLNEPRQPLNLSGLSQEQMDVVRNLYSKLKTLDEGEEDGFSR